jgi:glucosylceramidase
MRIRTVVFFVLLATVAVGAFARGLAPPAPHLEDIMNPEVRATYPARDLLFATIDPPVEPLPNGFGGSTIRVDPEQSFQSIDGFGYTLTGGSALHIARMEEAARATLLEELFGSGPESIGVSYLRVSVGSSDLDPETFSYSMPPGGAADPDLEHFSLDRDREYLIPVLREILAIRPDLMILGSPWSAPTWMKSNFRTVGGSLKQEYQAAYAAYFVRYIQEMAREGIRIDAMTVQNEPLHGGNNPSMIMMPFEQAAFIRDHLGPAFRAAGIETKIIIYDHNADRIDYPLRVLEDAEAAQYIDGSAFHLYGGEIDALSEVHDAFPDKNIYFTEQWVGAPGDLIGDTLWHVEHLIVGATRNWSRNVLEWNLAADPNQDPHTPGGCDRCLGAITISGNEITRNPAYYVIAHASAFVPPGSVRIHSSEVGGLPNVAFRTPDGRLVLIVVNAGSREQQVGLEIGRQSALLRVAPRGVMTLSWEAPNEDDG